MAPSSPHASSSAAIIRDLREPLIDCLLSAEESELSSAKEGRVLAGGSVAARRDATSEPSAAQTRRLKPAGAG